MVARAEVPKALYSVSDLAQRWGCSAPLIYALISSGTLESCKLAGRRVFTQAQIERFEHALETGIAADVRVHPTEKSSI